MLNHKDKLDGIDAIEGTRLVYNGKHKRLERREGIDRENVSISRDKNKVFTLNTQWAKFQQKTQYQALRKYALCLLGNGCL